MRKIRLESWKEKRANGTSEDVSLLDALKALLSVKDPKDIPRGLDKFRLFHQVDLAFAKAEQTKTLELEEATYEFLKSCVDKDIPSTWGMNPPLASAIEAFLSAKPEA